MTSIFCGSNINQPQLCGHIIKYSATNQVRCSGTGYDYLEYSGSMPWTVGNMGIEARYVMVGYSCTIDLYDDKFYINISNNTQSGLNVARFFALNISAEIRDTTD